MQESKKEVVRMHGTAYLTRQEKAFKLLFETTKWWPTREQLLRAHAGKPSHLHLSEMKDQKK